MPHIVSFSKLCSILLLVVATSCPLVGQEPTGIEAALPTLRQLNDPVVLLNALNGAAMQKMQADEVEKAIEYIDESLKLARQQEDASLIQGPLMTATQILNRTSPERATKFMIGLLNAEQGKPEVEKIILQRLGEHLQRSGDIVASIQVLYDFQAKCRKEDPNSETSAWALLQYGQVCLNGQMFDLAQPALSECKKLAEAIGRDDIASLCSASLANACLGTEQYDVAVEMFLAQLESAKKAKDKNGAFSAIAGLVTALFGGGKLDDAESVLKNNIGDSSGMLQAELLALRATLEILRGETKAALASSEQAADIRLQAIPLIARATVGDTTVMQDSVTQAYLKLSLGDLEGSLQSVRQAEKGYEQIRAQLENAARMGAVNLDSALTGYSAVLSAISDVRQQVYIQQGKPEDALLQAELGRGRAQVEAMRRLFNSTADKKASHLSIEDIRQLAEENQATLVFYSIVHPIDDITRARMGAAGKQLDARKLIVWVMHPSGKLASEQIDLPVSARELVRGLREEIAPEKAPPPTKDKSEEKEAGDKPKRSGNQDGGSTTTETGSEESPSPPQVAPESSVKHQRLAYDLLWKPVADQLPENPDATVVIVPHGELFAVPFGALLNEEEAPLIASHTLVTTASLELYHLAMERRKATGEFEVEKVLVVGNPKMPSYKFRPDKPAAPLDPLPGSEREANVIAEMFGIDALIGEQASEAAVKAKLSSAPVIHMATHGLLEADTVFTRSYLSSLALAPDADSDGFLTVREVMAMDLKAELAVLSACDSGRGTITGDGVVGLSRAFLAAGVPNVVVSLWPVSDQATAFMMVRFYEALGEGKSKAAALRSAILATREQAPNPRLWAPFLLYGAGN